jgi:hypothetical protein
MHPHLASVLASLDEASGTLKHAMESIPADRRSERPAPGRWSAAEVIEHLSLAEGGFATWITSGIEKARAAGLGNETAERTGLPDRIRTILGDRINRRQAPERVQPKGDMTADASLQALSKGERRLRTVLSLADGLALNEVIVEHPSLGPFNVYQWIELIAEHRRRHAAQIAEIGTTFSGVTRSPEA